MSKNIRNEDLFSVLKKYEERMDRLERAQATPQAAPFEFAGEGMAPDSRLRRNTSGDIVVEKWNGTTWVQSWSSVGADNQSIGWQNIPLRSGFAAYGAGFISPQYYRDATGRVHLRGLIRPAGAYTGSIMGDLPDGYRPSYTSIHGPAQTVPGGVEGAGRVDITPAGEIFQHQTSYPNGYISLDGISFMSAGGPFSGAVQIPQGWLPNQFVLPATPWWTGGAYGGIVNDGVEREVTSASGATSRIMLPTTTVNSHWKIRFRCLLSADSTNWTSLLGTIRVYGGDGVERVAGVSYVGSNKAATSNGNNWDWISMEVETRFVLSANQTGWYAIARLAAPTQYGGVYHRDYPYCDFIAERIS